MDVVSAGLTNHVDIRARGGRQREMGKVGGGKVVPLGLKKLRASMAELRSNSKTLPWMSLAPDLLTTSTTAPELRPCSALNMLGAER